MFTSVAKPSCLLALWVLLLVVVPVRAQGVQIFHEQVQTVPHRVTHPYASSSVPTDSVYYDDGDNSLGFSISVGEFADELYLAVRFDVATDFELTHVRFWGRRDGDTVSGDVTVDVYDGSGANPSGSTLLSSRTYPDLLTPSGRFRYVSLDTPLSFGTGESFFIVVRAEDSPKPGGPLGGDFGPGTGDYAGRSFFSTSGDGWSQIGDIDEDGFEEVFLIRAVTDDGEPPSVCDGDITLTTQAEVDAFECTEVGGDLSISDGFINDDITDLSPLSVLGAVGGTLSITDNDMLPSLAGLENLTAVDETLQLSGNDLLTSFEGLEGLSSVGEDLQVFLHPVLTSFAGLESLTSVGDGLAINENLSLNSLEGLESLATIGGRVEIGGNAVLSSLSGLDNLTTVGGGFGIFGHPELVSLTALENFTDLGGPMTIRGNSALVSLAGLDGVTSIAGALLIGENAALASLEGLSSLTSIENALAIFENPALESLGGLEGITAVATDLFVIDNATLSDCACGLAGVISGDPPVFSGVGGMVTVENNALDGACASPEIVLDAFADAMCMPVSNESSSDVSDRFVLSDPFPNPASHSTKIPYELSAPTHVRLAIYDVLGREVAVLVDGARSEGQHETVFDAASFPSGLYFVRVTTGRGSTLTRRMTLAR